jgi:hypothetical protein
MSTDQPVENDVPVENRTWGHRAPTPDARDHRYQPRLRAAFGLAAAPALPASVDLRPEFAFLPPTDQGTLNACTAHPISAVVAYMLKKQHPKVPPLSPLFIYYNERVIENDVTKNAPVEMRSGLKAVSQQGACTLDVWPYDPTQYAVQPAPAAFADGKHRLIVTYEAVDQDTDHLKSCLAEGYPFLFGFSVFPSFRGSTLKATGHMQMPASFDSPMGGHAVAGVGYDDANQWFICRNSFGTDWGLSGYFTIPYTFLLNPKYTHDIWKVTEVRWDQQ